MRTHFSRPAHFVGSESCQFGITDIVGHYIVSTVGDYRPNYSGGRQEPIGYGRTYETMVFAWKEGKRCEDAECGCEIPFADSYMELDFEGYNSKSEAEDGHRRMVNKWRAAQCDS